MVTAIFVSLAPSINAWHILMSRFQCWSIAALSTRKVTSEVWEVLDDDSQ